jgi:hypothetical protein
MYNNESIIFFYNLWSFIDISWKSMSLKIWQEVASYLMIMGYFLLRNFFRLLQLWPLEGPIDLPNICAKADFHVNSKWTPLLIIDKKYISYLFGVTTSIQIRPYYFNLASFFLNCYFSEVGIFFRNLISDNESFMFWYSFAEISTQNYKSGRNMSINWSNLNRGCR